MRKHLCFVLVLLLCMTAVFAQGAQEKSEEVKYGELDLGYVDKDGDMVADHPEDPSEYLDPETLIFAYTPVEDPAVYEDVFQEFMEHLSKMTGKKVKWFAVDSYATQVEAMRAGRLHVSGFAAGSVQDAVNHGGFVPLAAMGYQGSMVGYTMQIIVRKDSGLKEISDLNGKTIAFVSESSNSGYSAPRALLYQLFGMLPEKNYIVAFSGKHDNSILGVYNGDYDVGAIASTVLTRMVNGDRVPDASQWCDVLYESQVFPVTAWGVTNRLSPELTEKIKEAFLSFDFVNSKLHESWPEDDSFIAIDYAKDYEVLRVIRDGSAAVAEILGE